VTSVDPSLLHFFVAFIEGATDSWGRDAETTAALMDAHAALDSATAESDATISPDRIAEIRNQVAGISRADMSMRVRIHGIGRDGQWAGIQILTGRGVFTVNAGELRTLDATPEEIQQQCALRPWWATGSDREEGS
jgi:hypothetical protein